MRLVTKMVANKNGYYCKFCDFRTILRPKLLISGGIPLYMNYINGIKLYTQIFVDMWYYVKKCYILPTMWVTFRPLFSLFLTFWLIDNIKSKTAQISLSTFLFTHTPISCCKIQYLCLKIKLLYLLVGTWCFTPLADGGLTLAVSHES